MKPAAFDMRRPETLEEALQLLSEHADDAKLLAGGQSLVPTMNFRLAVPGLLIDLNRVVGLSGVRRDGDRLCIGAMTRQAALLEDPLVAAHAPLLAQALAHVGHVQTRSRGTIGGSIVHADPAAELPLVMTVLDAALTLVRASATRTVAAAEFFVDALVTTTESDEILTEIAIPIAPAGARCVFREYSRRHGDFAIVAVAGQATPSGLALGVGGLIAVPRRCRAIESASAGRAWTEAQFSAVLDAEFAGIQMLSDLQASGDYRRQLATVLLGDVLAALGVGS